MPQGQSLTVVKSEPLDAPLSVVKSEPLVRQAATPPPAANPSIWPSPMEAIRGFGRALFNTSDLGVSADTPKIMSADTLGGQVGAGLATRAVLAAAPEVAIPAAGVVGVARAIPWAYRAAAGAAGIAGAAAGGAAGAATEGQPVGPAAAWQTGLQTLGMGTGWLFNAVGRRLTGLIPKFNVAQQAADKLQAEHGEALGTFQQILRDAQDAIDAHKAGRAADTVARARVVGSLGATAAAATGEARAAQAAGEAAQVSGNLRTQTLKQRWPTTEESLAPPMRPQPAPGQQAVYGHTQDGMGIGPDVPMYQITDPTHPRFGSHVSAATLAEEGIPIPSHTPSSLNPTARAAQATAAVVGGPAQTSLNKLGQAVEGAAETGPRVSLAPLKQRLTAMVEKATPAAPVPPVPTLTAGETQVLQRAQKAGLTEDQFRAHIGKSVPIEPEHPLPGVLDRIMKAGDGTDQDLVPFSEAHKLKRMLDDAIGWKPAGAVIAPARGQLKQITKGIRGGIREAMAGHAPYDQATAAYADASKLFAPKGLARQIQATAQINPERLVNTLVNPKEPTKFQMLKEVLTHHAREGGGEEGAQAGQEAWQAVQSTVMYKHLIQPGIDKFDQSVAKMHPEFLQILTGDPYAKQVFDRLGTMSQAVKASEARTASEVAGHEATRADALNLSRVAKGKAAEIKATGARATAQAGVEGQQLQRNQRVAQRDVTEARQPTAAEQAFAKSSLGKAPPSAGQQLGDVAYATMAPPGSPRQIAGAFRLLARGPKVNDLIHWASLSDDNTQMFVRAVSSPHAAEAMAALGRGVDELMRQHKVGFPPMAVSHDQGGVQPPPQARVAATPPPGKR